MRGWVVSDAGLASGTVGLELVGAPGDLDSVSAPGLAVLGVWDSEPVVAALGVWDSERGVAALGVWDSGTWCGGAWSLRLGAGLGARRKSEHRSQSSNAQQAAMSHLVTNPRVPLNAAKNQTGSGTQDRINASKGGRFLAC